MFIRPTVLFDENKIDTYFNRLTHRQLTELAVLRPRGKGGWMIGLSVFPALCSRYRSAGIVTVRPRNPSIPGRGKGVFFSSPVHTGSGHPHNLFNVHPKLFPLCKAVVADHSHSSGAEVKNQLSYTFIPPYSFFGCRDET